MTKPEKSKLEPIAPIRFGETTGKDVYNASEIVAIADSRFLFCDNNVGDALFEIVLTPEGTMAGPLIRRPLEGLAAGAVDDLEGLALVRSEAGTFLFATPSFSLKQRKNLKRKKTERGKPAPARAGLVRIRLGADTRLEAELIPDLRSWLVERVPKLEKAARLLPDDGGLNVEALGWDPTLGALLFGVRTPVPKRGPMVLRVRVRDIGGPWELDNLELLPPCHLRIEDVGEEQGIRSIEYDEARKVSFVVVGNSTSRSKAPFHLYSWDGNPEGEVRRFPGASFAKNMKAEGVAPGTVGGRGGVVFVDDGGGYQVLWDDDARLAVG